MPEWAWDDPRMLVTLVAVVNEERRAIEEGRNGAA